MKTSLKLPRQLVFVCEGGDVLVDGFCKICGKYTWICPTCHVCEECKKKAR